MTIVLTYLVNIFWRTFSLYKDRIYSSLGKSSYLTWATGTSGEQHFAKAKHDLLARQQLSPPVTVNYHRTTLRPRSEAYDCHSKSYFPKEHFLNAASVHIKHTFRFFTQQWCAVADIKPYCTEHRLGQEFKIEIILSYGRDFYRPNTHYFQVKWKCA